MAEPEGIGALCDNFVIQLLAASRFRSSNGFSGSHKYLAGEKLRIADRFANLRGEWLCDCLLPSRAFGPGVPNVWLDRIYRFWLNCRHHREAVDAWPRPRWV